MLQGFKKFIHQQKLFAKEEAIILAVSGGIDSVVMIDLFSKSNYSFAIAHCNFGLRGNESNGDERFVKELSKKYNVPYYQKKFNTQLYSQQKKISIQMAARELRYEWFKELCASKTYKYVAIAHHQSDSVETFFINLIRGTGISGLHGIIPKKENSIRPLLFATKKDIEEYAKENKIKYREDSSNASDDYVRNKIRHHLIPLLKEINPNIENTIIENSKHLNAFEKIVRNEIDKTKKNILTIEQERVLISIEKLKKSNPIKTYLFEILKEYHFKSSVIDEIISAVEEKQSGKTFLSTTHILLRDRKFLILEKLPTQRESPISKIEFPDGISSFETEGIRLSLTKKLYKKEEPIKTKATIATIDFDKLKFPLTLRKWENGDYFYPLGLKGKKKLSDFFIDTKLPLFQKKNTWLIISDSKIVWIVGQRIDERFKITPKTKNIYFIELL